MDSLSRVLAEFRALTGERLDAVWYEHIDGFLGRIILSFDTRALAVTANADDDTVTVATQPWARNDAMGHAEASRVVPWNGLIGQPFGWGWAAINKQGYLDGLLFSFGDDIVPCVFLNVVTSSIVVCSVAQSGGGSPYRPN